MTNMTTQKRGRFSPFLFLSYFNIEMIREKYASMHVSTTNKKHSKREEQLIMKEKEDTRSNGIIILKYILIEKFVFLSGDENFIEIFQTRYISKMFLLFISDICWKEKEKNVIATLFNNFKGTRRLLKVWMDEIEFKQKRKTEPSLVNTISIRIEFTRRWKLCGRERFMRKCNSQCWIHGCNYSITELVKRLTLPSEYDK